MANAMNDPQRTSALQQQTLGYRVTGQFVSPILWEIRRERRIEMFGEGVRYDDIRRWACGNLLTLPRRGINITGAGFTPEQQQTLRDEVGVNEKGELLIYSVRYTGQNPEPQFEDPKDYLSPIPTDEIGVNPNLEQNPGWQ